MEDLKAKDLLASRANKRVCQDVKRLGVDTFADNVLMPKLAKTFPAVSFGNISSASHDLAQSFSLCCDTDVHPAICIMKKIGRVHALLCSESSSLYPELDACCHMAPYGRLGCIYKLSHSSAGPQVTSGGTEEVADHAAECSAEPKALKK
ncbi:serum albumin SDS-1-like, partial [Lampetra fluviatilis]